MKVFVVIEEFYGTVADVNVYKNKPKDIKEMKDGEDEGERCYEVEIQEENSMNKKYHD